MCDQLAGELEEYKQKNPDQSIFLVGGGMNLCYNTFGERLGCLTVSDQFSTQRAGEVALAVDEYEQVSPSELVPSYLRLPQAERELKKKSE